MCDGFQSSLLSVGARITNLKYECSILNRAIDGLASLVKDICLDDNNIPDTFYGAKKLLASLVIAHKRIDVCLKGCMLF